MKEHDDGIVVKVYAETVADVLEHFAEGDMASMSDHRAIAEARLADAKKRWEDLEPGARDAARDLQHMMHYLWQVERGEVQTHATAFEFGVMFGEAMERLRVCLESSDLNKQQQQRRLRAQSKRAARESALWRHEKHADFRDAIRKLYSGFHGTKSAFVAYLERNERQRLETEYPGCGLSKSSIYKILEGLK